VNAALQPIVERVLRTRRNTPDKPNDTTTGGEALIELERTSSGSDQNETHQHSATRRSKDRTTTRTGRRGGKTYGGRETQNHTHNYGSSGADLLRPESRVVGGRRGGGLRKSPASRTIPVPRARELSANQTLRLVLPTASKLQKVNLPRTRSQRRPNKSPYLVTTKTATNIAAAEQRVQNDPPQDLKPKVRKTEMSNIDPFCGMITDPAKNIRRAGRSSTARPTSFVHTDEPQTPQTRTTESRMNDTRVTEQDRTRPRKNDGDGGSGARIIACGSRRVVRVPRTRSNHHDRKLPIPRRSQRHTPDTGRHHRAGPAGLTADTSWPNAAQTAPSSGRTTWVGGHSARTGGQTKDGAFDIGGHGSSPRSKRARRSGTRSFSGRDFPRRPPPNRALFYDGKYFDYPMRSSNRAQQLGIVEAVKCGRATPGPSIATQGYRPK